MRCADAEGDRLTHEVSGPGRNLVSSPVVAGDGRSVNWSYITAAVDGEERATYWATDDFGARGAPADRGTGCAETGGMRQARPGAVVRRTRLSDTHFKARPASSCSYRELPR